MLARDSRGGDEVIDRDDSTPSEIIVAANEVASGTLPPASRKLYEQCYEKFQEWKTNSKIPPKNFSEDTLLVYFSHLSETLAPPTLWTKYSMLKAVIYLRDDLDISKYRTLISYIKRKNERYEGKQAQVFTPEQCNEFIDRAPDSEYLTHKVVMIFGICGAMRIHEMLNLDIDNVEICSSGVKVRLPKALNKNKKVRSFTIDEESYVSIVSKYRSLRPAEFAGRFFVNFLKKLGTCTKQFIGRNKLAKMPAETAQFLQLEDAKLYTGHSYRRTSGTLLADGGGNEIDVLRHGGWSSMSTARRYIKDSTSHSKQLGKKITDHLKANTWHNADDIEASTSRESVAPVHIKEIRTPQISSKDIHINTSDHASNTESSFCNNTVNIHTSELTSPSKNMTPAMNSDSGIDFLFPNDDDLFNIDEYVIEEVGLSQTIANVQKNTENRVTAGGSIFNFNFTNCNVTIVNNKPE